MRNQWISWIIWQGYDLSRILWQKSEVENAVGNTYWNERKFGFSIEILFDIAMILILSVHLVFKHMSSNMGFIVACCIMYVL